MPNEKKRSAPYCHQHVHCAHCEPCQNDDCLKTDTLRRRCVAATRRDDLKAHTLSHHKGKTPLAVGDERPRSQNDFFSLFHKHSQNDRNSPSSSSTASPSPSPLSSTPSPPPPSSAAVPPIPPAPPSLPSLPTPSVSTLQSETSTQSSSLPTESETVSMVLDKNIGASLGDVSVISDEFADEEENELLFQETTIQKSSSEISMFKKIDKKLDSLKDTVCSLFNKMTLNTKSMDTDEMAHETGAMSENLPAEVKPDESDESQTESAMKPCRSIVHIETFFPFFKYKNNHFMCLICQEFHGNLNGKSKKYTFSYDETSGVDFTNVKILPRDFRNLKTNLKRHITVSELHREAAALEKKKTKDNEIHQRNSISAGQSLGRIAYAILYRARPLSDFTMDVLLNAKNGACVGDINHSKYFVNEFRSHCANILMQKLKRHLMIPLNCTGRCPPIVVSCDKMTEKRRSGQMTAIATLFSDAKADEMNQTFFIGNPVVRDHTGKGLANSVAEELEKVCSKKSLASQLVGGGTDGQYFTLGVPQILKDTLGLHKAFFTWDPAHRLMLADKDVRNQKVGGKDQFPFLNDAVSTISDFLAHAKYGKKYEYLLKVSEKYPEIKFYKLHSISTTRFAGYFHDVLFAFIKDILFIIICLKEQAKDDDAAKSLLRRIFNTKFIGFLAALVDFYACLGKLCNSLQRVNLFIWERQKMVTDALATIEKMILSIQNEVVDKTVWPSVAHYWPLLEDKSFVEGLPDFELENYSTRRETQLANASRDKPLTRV